ncbi:MAG: heparinase [Hungatella sp.]|nr:heparinase [Hungatella sp.]
MFKEIAENAVPAALFDAYPAVCDRTAWEKIPENYRVSLIKEGEKWLNYEFSPIYASDYMEFCRTGNRSNYEDKQFERRIALDALVLAECAENQGRFLDSIINIMFLICEETAWQLPAHNTYLRDTPQHILPDVTRPIIDLFAAETGAVLAMAEYLLRDVLYMVSPTISKLVNHNLETRIFSPYQKEHFWWMGDGESPMNNWTAWCTQNVLIAAFTRDLSEEMQEAIIKKACKSLDYFLKEYGEDGCCDEGAQYYRHAGLTLFNAMEILNWVCKGAFSCLYEEIKIRNIASYIQKVHVAGPYYVNFADCSPVAGRCGVREYLFGKRTGNEGLMAFAAADYRECVEKLSPEEHNLLYRVQAAFYHEEMMEYGKKQSNFNDRTKDYYFPSVGLFIARDSNFCLAVKAGDNADSHNHNDVGSFTIYKDGKPLFIDVGVESYTKKTFSPQRYEIWTMQSQYHNLPTFGGIMEQDGEKFQANCVKYEIGDEKSWISMDLAGAYPECHIISYIRTACLKKGKGIYITDRWEGDSDAKDVVLSLMTYEKPKIVNKNQEFKMSIGNLAVCQIIGGSQIQTEEISIVDSRLKITWKHNIFRTLVTFGGNEIQLILFRR